MLSPARRRQCVDHLQAELGISERRACAVAGQHRSTQRKRPRGRDDEEALTAAIIRLASQYGRYGYRRITALLRTEGWHVNAKRVQRIWRREGLKVPQKQPKRGRLWLNDGSCIRLRPCWPNHVWSYDFVMDRTHDGRKFRMLTVIDEFTRRCMAVVVERRLNSDITNNFSLPAATICALYKSRWQVELFFKWIKQHLRIKQFYGTSENAVKTQIWIAVSVYVLVAIVKKRLDLDASLYTLLQILSVTLFEKMPIHQALAGDENRCNASQITNQLNLFDF